MIHPSGKISLILTDKVQAELKRMTDLGVIEKVKTITDWANSMVIEEKPGGKLSLLLSVTSD